MSTLSVVDELRTRLLDSDGAIPPRDLLAAYAHLSDAELAEVVEIDGRTRLDLGVEVSLDSYVLAIPELRNRPVVLDAAIDMVLRSRSSDGGMSTVAVEEIVATYPEFEIAIRHAAMLGDALWSTRQLRPTRSPYRDCLPCDFGPRLPSGATPYRLERYLGGGAFGDVFLGVDRQLSDTDRPALVAVKVCAARKIGVLTRRRLIDEAAKARRIDHPNVVRVLHRGATEQDEEFIVYEYVEGGDLRAWARRAGLPVDAQRAGALMAWVARGVQAAHSAGLVHCDLNPGNVLISSGGVPKVADFGIAVRASSDEPVPDDGPANRFAGTPAFMAPEQFRREPGAFDPPVDVYAIGGMLFWLLSGIPPNGQTIEEINERLGSDEHADSVAIRLRARRPEIDGDLAAICLRAMSPEPQDRYSAPGTLADDLEAWIRHEPIYWTDPSLPHIGRLWVLRRPVAAMLILACTVCTLLGVAIGSYGLAMARQQKSALRQEQEWRMIGAQVMARGRAGTEVLATEGLESDLLTNIWLSEWILGETILGEPDRASELWSRRLTIIEDRLARNRAAGLDDALDTLLWESALGFWLVNAGDYGRAGPLLLENERRWQERLPPDDPWLATIEALRWCAAAGQILDLSGRGEIASDLWKDARDACDALTRLEPTVRQISTSGPVRLLIFDLLADLNGPGLIDDPVAAQRARATAARLRSLR